MTGPLNAGRSRFAEAGSLGGHLEPVGEHRLKLVERGRQDGRLALTSPVAPLIERARIRSCCRRAPSFGVMACSLDSMSDGCWSGANFLPRFLHPPGTWGCGDVGAEEKSI